MIAACVIFALINNRGYMTNKENTDVKVLDSISIITKKLANSKLKIKRTREFLKAEEQLNMYFKTTSGGTWMLCGIISYYFNHMGMSCDFNDLSEFFSAPVMSVIAFKDDIENLLVKGYINNTRSLNEKEIGLRNEFQISTELLHCILHNKKIVFNRKKEKANILTDLIKKMGNLIESPENEIEKVCQIEKMEETYSDIEFIAKTLQLISDDIYARMFFYACCSDLLSCSESNLNRILNNICDDDGIKYFIADSFLNENYSLLKNDLLEFTEKGNLTNSTVELTIKAKKMLLGKNAKLFLKSAKGMNVILPENIQKKDLFYNRENKAEINRLKSSLYEENLQLIQERLETKGLPKGIAVLLYGAPGTGKTESVYQIAKETGRSIFHVDISSTKSCWYGESEKIIKRIFIDYKQLCKASRSEKKGKAPILLFNEADGILSKRKDSTSHVVDQTENAMQNIILEEMETLEGIMVCTTNLVSNLDSAFERRFLFKIKFENPTIVAKQKIWKSKLAWLNDDVISCIAENYDLSGGQIDNIVRKITMDEILSGKKPDYDELKELCKNEKLGGTERKIGFF